MASTNGNSADLEHVNKEQNASQQFLDSKQYARKSVQKYERIFGKDFVSTGGVSTTSHFCDLIFNGLASKYGGNNPGPYKVLDIGCGIGGSAFYMARNFNIASVLGLDLSSNMITIANEKVEEYLKTNSSSAPDSSSDSKESDQKQQQKGSDFAKKVSFLIGDALKQDFEENSFDLIYSRDTILHIFDKSVLFGLFYKWIKPNGVLFISDYCCSEPSTHSSEFKKYVAKRGYHLYTPMAYGKLIGDAGFERVIVEDRTKQMISILKKEKETFLKIKDEFIKDFSEEDFQDILNGWDNKIVRCGKGEQRWGAFMAYKNVVFDE